MNEMIGFLKKRSKIVIWAVGLLILWFILSRYENEPPFIQENGLVTWNMVEKTFWAIAIIIGLQNLTSNYLFRDEDQEKWSNDIDNRVEVLEKRTESLGKHLEVISNWALEMDEQKRAGRLSPKKPKKG